MNRRIVALLAICVPLLGAVAQTATNYWDVNGVAAGLGGSGTWDTNTANWNDASGTGTPVVWTNGAFEAVFGGTPGAVTLSGGISAGRLTFNSSYILTNSLLTLLGRTPTFTVASGVTVSNFAALGGADGLVLNGPGTLVLTNNTNRITGDIVVSNGTLVVSNANGIAAALRGNRVNLSAGTSVLATNGSADLRLGALVGQGGLTNYGGGGVAILILSNATFSGGISAPGGLNLRGLGRQILEGNTTGLGGTMGVNSGAELVLRGTGDSTSGVLSNAATPLALRGSTITLDNSAGNTSSSYGRVNDGSDVSFLGGRLEFIGHSTGSSETVGAWTMNAGSATVRVIHNGGVSGTILTFTDGGNLRNSTAGTVNFIGSGGALGAAGANPRIVFSSTINSNTSSGMLSSGGSSATVTSIGWARVNGTNWAGASAGGTIYALPDTTRTSANLSSAGANELVSFTPTSATTTLASSLGASTLKINPTASGQTLALSSGSVLLNVSATMLAGSTDFAITGGALGTYGATRYVYVTETNTTLSFSGTLVNSGANGSQQPLTKSGPGIFNLNGAANQMGFGLGTGTPGPQNINVLEGVLRGTLTSLGGSTSSGGAYSTLRLFGGVLEISGGGSLTRAIDLSGAAAGGGIIFDGGSADRGDGGFSSINGAANVALVTTIGGSTLATLQWDNGAFLANGYSLLFGSTKADSRITLTNSIALDSTNAANSYFAREVRVFDNPNSTTDVARLAGNIGGGPNADLLKTGAGVLEFGGTNTYQGATLIREGTLRAVANTNFSRASKHVVMGGILDLNGFNQEVAEVVLESGSIIGGGSLTGTVFQVQSGSVDATLAGEADLWKTGAGTVELLGANEFTGSANVLAGRLRAANSSAFGLASQVIVSPDATLELSGGIGIFTPLTVSGVGVGGGGAIRNHSGANIYNGLITLVGDTLVVNNAGLDQDLSFGDDSGNSFEGSGNLTFDHSSRIYVNDPIGTGTGSVTKSGTGFLYLTGNSSFTGGTILNGGTTFVTADTSFGAEPASPDADNIRLNGAEIQFSTSFTDLTMLHTNRGIVLDSGGGTLSADYSATIAGPISGIGNLAVGALGTIKFTNVNTFTGNLTITTGVLDLAVDGALSGPGEIDINAGGTLLFSGAGNRINDLAGVVLGGGAINTAGLSEQLGALTLSANSTIDLGDGSSVLSFADSSGQTWTGTLLILNWSGVAQSEGGIGGGADQLIFGNSSSALTAGQLSQVKFQFGWGLSDAVMLANGEVIAAVPEPATVAGALGLLGVAGWWERRRWASLGRQLLRRAQRVPAYVIRNAVLAFFGFLIFGTIFFFA